MQGCSLRFVRAAAQKSTFAEEGADLARHGRHHAAGGTCGRRADLHRVSELVRQRQRLRGTPRSPRHDDRGQGRGTIVDGVRPNLTGWDEGDRRRCADVASRLAMRRPSRRERLRAQRPDAIGSEADGRCR